MVRNATPEDFDMAFEYIEKLWAYNTYSKDAIRQVYLDVLENKNNFVFFLFNGEKTLGFCHGTFFDTFWMSGTTCYLSSIITNQDERGKGYGRRLMNRVRDLATERGCRAIILDSGIPRKEAHRFYEAYGFEQCAYCFVLPL